MNHGADTMTTKAFKPGFRLVFWAGAFALLMALLVYAFWPKAMLVDVGEVTHGELVVGVRAEGRTRVRDLYVVTAPLTGHLQRIGNRTGESVRKGDVVAVLDPSEAALLDPRLGDHLVVKLGHLVLAAAVEDHPAKQDDQKA